MTPLREILAKRETIRTELRAIIDKYPDGNMPDEVSGHCDQLEAEAGRLNDAERRQVLVDDLDRRASGQPIGGTADSFEAAASATTLFDVCRAQMGGLDVGAGRAREVSAELERRSGRKAQGLFFRGATRPTEQRVFTSAVPAPGGGYMIATDVGPMIDRLRERLVIKALGATIIPNVVGNLVLPRLKTSAVGHWVAENVAITASDPATDSVEFTPKHVGGLVEVSRQMLQQSSPDVSRVVEDDLAKIIAVAIDRAAVKGGGTSEPQGLLYSGSGITSSSMTGAAMTWDNVLDMIGQVDVANALSGSLAWLTNARVVSKLRRTLKTESDTSSDIVMTDPGTLAGYPLASTMLMPASDIVSEPNDSHIIFGDFSQLCLAFWGSGELDVLINHYDTVSYSKGNIQIRAMSTCCVGVKQPLAFSARTSVGTASF